MSHRPSSSSSDSIREVERELAALRTSSDDSSAIGASSSKGPMRKSDLAYNHVTFVPRPGTCKPICVRKTLDVLANHFRMSTPPKMQAHAYRIEIEKNFKGRWELVLKRDKAEPLFWSLYQHHRQIFPASLKHVVFDGVATIYSLQPLRIRDGDLSLNFPADPPRATPAAQPPRQGRGGPQRAPAMARARITVNPMVVIEDFFTDDEALRPQIVSILDLILSQEMRCPLVNNAAHFTVVGHSLFKAPTSDREKRMCVHPIGMGEEIWRGLHMAVKADAPDSLFVNSNVSSSIFYTPSLNLVDFYSQVMHGYKLNHTADGTRLMIEPRKIRELEEILKGTKIRILFQSGDYKKKKFESITTVPAANLNFVYCPIKGSQQNSERMSVADYFARVRQQPLQYPNLPCVEFRSKVRGESPSWFPLEVCTTAEEPRKYKGKLSDSQLNAFIKAAGMDPGQKRSLIDSMMSADGSYLGQGELAREWGVEVDRKMVEIKDAKLLKFPNMQWGDAISTVDEISGEYQVADNKPRKMVQGAAKALAVVMVFATGVRRLPENQQHEYDSKYKKHTEFLGKTLHQYGMDVVGPAWIFQELFDDNGYANTQGLEATVAGYKAKIAEAAANNNKQYLPLFVFVFPRRIEKLYAAVKSVCEVQHGVLSQCILTRTFQKFDGNPVTNQSGQNIMLKVLAKAGGVACRIDGNQFKSLGKMTNPEEPTLILAIDVSHPGREERIRALQKSGRTLEQAVRENASLGQHEQLPTARKAAASLFGLVPDHLVPRSVVSVVGNTDLPQTKWGVSSRVQRLGQEETLNLRDPFAERIDDFHKKSGVAPKHIVVYRDGVSDTQFKKALYEETEALKMALEKLSLTPEEVTISYIVAKKRHHTRFFAANPQDAIDLAGNSGGNCPPGLLIEEVVTSRNNFDFFLQSHYGNLGTAVPTHYTVLADDWKVTPSFWQTVVFAHCFGNARCTRPLSIPVPLHYAHLAAKRAKVAFDHFKENAPDEYRACREALVREDLEQRAITVNEALSAFGSMYFA